MTRRAAIGAIAAVVAAGCGGPARSPGARAGSAPALRIAIYPHTAIVRAERAVQLSAGRAQMSLDGVPRRIEPGSVRVRSRTDPAGVQVTAQRIDGGTATWDVDARTAGAHAVELSYETGGLSWRADYAVVLDGDRADVDAWISLRNESGASFRGAAIALVVDDTPATSVPDGATSAPSNLDDGRGSMVQSRPAAEQVAMPSPASLAFRAFPMPSPVDLPDGARRQVPWFGAPLRRVPSRRRIELDAATGAIATSVEVDVHTASALPPGRMRVYERRGSRLDLIGAAELPATPPSTPLRVALGAVRDMRSQRRQIERRVDPVSGRAVEEVEISIDSVAGQRRRVRVRERFPADVPWHIAAATVEPVVAGAREVTFDVEVPAGGRASVTYRVVYGPR